MPEGMDSFLFFFWLIIFHEAAFVEFEVKNKELKTNMLQDTGNISPCLFISTSLIFYKNLLFSKDCL